MPFRKLLWLVLLSPYVSAATWEGNWNLTISFFADKSEASCGANDTSQSLVLTTSTLPAAFTCFDLADIFSQKNDTGFQSDRQPIWGANRPNGIAWLLQNREKYDAKTNYSNVWYRQVNASNEDGVKGNNLMAPWVVGVYAYPGCGDARNDTDQNRFPWYQTSCQTQSGGQCRTLPYPIRSFGIWSAGLYRQDLHEECMTWARFGAAAGFGRAAFVWAVVSACTTVLFLML